MGGIKSLICNNLCIKIWEWCLQNDACLTASHIPGKDKFIADKASCKFNDHHEWKLKENSFGDFCKIFEELDMIYLPPY